MRMTVYGNNATCPEADGACSCFLIEAEGRRILLDMGNGSLATVSYTHLDVYKRQFQKECESLWAGAVSPEEFAQRVDEQAAPILSK